MPLDWNKPLQTKQGEQARLLGIVDSSSPRLTHIVAVKDAVDGTEYVFSYNKFGEHFEDGEHAPGLDLINPPQKLTRWLNYYPDGSYVQFHKTREEADKAAKAARPDYIPRLACIKVQFEEGEGL